MTTYTDRFSIVVVLLLVLLWAGVVLVAQHIQANTYQLRPAAPEKFHSQELILP